MTRQPAAAAAALGVRQTKYGSKKQELDGFVFDSKAEAMRYLVLRERLRAGDILYLEPHPTYLFEHNGHLIGRYTPDFRYVLAATGETVVEDVKSKPTKTEAYGLRKRMMLAFHGIKVVEVMRR